MNNLLPCVGGFNDGKYIEPKGRTVLKMGKPSEYPNPPGVKEHRDDMFTEFTYEVYNLTTFFSIGDRKIQFFLAEGISLEDAVERIVLGYKQFKKKKNLTY